MKRLFTTSVIFFLLILLSACTQYSAEIHEEYDHSHEYDYETHTYVQEEEAGPVASWAADEISFSSVEDFLNAYVTASAGGDIDHLASEWHDLFMAEDITFTESAYHVDFTSLENFHLPVGIPEEFELFTIRVLQGAAEFTFLHPEDMISEHTVRNAFMNFRELRFMFFRWDMDETFLFNNMTEGSMEHDILIDGKYLFGEGFGGGYSVDWISDRTRFILHLPATTTNDRSETNELGGISLDDPHAMISFTETTTLNLQDTRAVETMIEELEAARR